MSANTLLVRQLGLRDWQPVSDAMRSKAWRQRETEFLRTLIIASGNTPAGRSPMSQLKSIFASLWAQTLVETPAELMRHDPGLSHAERRRISSVKNNRTFRLRQALFVNKIEQMIKGEATPAK